KRRCIRNAVSAFLIQKEVCMLRELGPCLAVTLAALFMTACSRITRPSELPANAEKAPAVAPPASVRSATDQPPPVGNSAAPKTSASASVDESAAVSTFAIGGAIGAGRIEGVVHINTGDKYEAVIGAQLEVVNTANGAVVAKASSGVKGRYEVIVGEG